MGMQEKMKALVCAQEVGPTSKKMECKFCKLELVYRKDRMVAHLGYKKNDDNMRG